MRCSTDHHNLLVQQAPLNFLVGALPRHGAVTVDEASGAGHGGLGGGGDDRVGALGDSLGATVPVKVGGGVAGVGGLGVSGGLPVAGIGAAAAPVGLG